MISKLFLITASLLAVSNGAPSSSPVTILPQPPSVITPAQYKGPSTNGTHPNQGVHPIFGAPHNPITPAPQDGVGSVVTGPGLNWYNPDLTAGTGGLSDPTQYICYSGPKENFPPISEWMNFMSAFGLNRDISMVINDSPIEIDAIWHAIQTVSAESLVDARLILAVIMQESTGNVHVPCTVNGNTNCGLMQAWTGSVSYNPADPYGSVLQMVRDGTEGTSQGPGYVQWIAQNSETSWQGPTDGNPYAAARGYNSGRIDLSNLNNGFTGTASYVSDIANRLRGWDGLGGGSANC